MRSEGSFVKKMIELKKEKDSVVLETQSLIINAIPNGNKYCCTAAGYCIGRLINESYFRYNFSISQALTCLNKQDNKDNRLKMYEEILSFVKKLAKSLGDQKLGISVRIVTEEDMKPYMIPVEFIIPIHNPF